MRNNPPAPCELVIDSKVAEEISREPSEYVEVIVHNAGLASLSRVRNRTLLVHHTPHAIHHFLAFECFFAALVLLYQRCLNLVQITFALESLSHSS